MCIQAVASALQFFDHAGDAILDTYDDGGNAGKMTGAYQLPLAWKGMVHRVTWIRLQAFAIALLSKQTSNIQKRVGCKYEEAVHPKQQDSQLCRLQSDNLQKGVLLWMSMTHRQCCYEAQPTGGVADRRPLMTEEQIRGCPTSCQQRPGQPPCCPFGNDTGRVLA